MIPVPLDAKVEQSDDSNDAWRVERVTFNAAYGKDRVLAYLFLPRKTKPPYSVILYWPGSNAIRTSSSRATPDLEVFQHLVLSGRAVLYPVYYGTYERQDGHDWTWSDMTRGYSEWVRKQVQDARRSLDYLETRLDIRHDVIGYYGFSWGARMGLLVLARSRVSARPCFCRRDSQPRMLRLKSIPSCLLRASPYLSSC